LVAGERPDWEWYQQSSEQVGAGQLDAAEDRIEAALQAGHLMRVSLLLAPALEPLRGRARFESLAAEARRRIDALALEPKVLVANPGRLAPLLLTLHGATGNAVDELERWRPATELGWIVAAGQSSQPATESGFCWDPPRERIWRDLRAISAMLPPHGRVIVAGFSQGAWIALNTALKADIIVAGAAIMVAPFAGPDPNLPPAWRRLRISILVGEDDVYRDPVERLAKLLKEREHHVFLDVVNGLGHAYPADFVERLPALLKP
jgi:predicted esterase